MNTLVSKFIQATLSEAKLLLENTDQTHLKELKEYFDNSYYNDSSVIDDWKYDMFLEYYSKHNSSKCDLEPLKVGHKIREDDIEVKLPFWMGSLNKVKSDDLDSLVKWMKKSTVNEFIVTDKLDGVSCMAIYNRDAVRTIQLCTRGNGNTGKDISYIIPFIKLPVIKDSIVIRGELVISKSNFKNMSDASNPRNSVSGLVKAKTIQVELKYVDFVAYEVLSITEQKSQSEQLGMLTGLGFKTVYSTKTRLEDMSSISGYLDDRKDMSEYEIDGIVLQYNMPYTLQNSGNPSYALAFKTDSFGESTVVNVHWSISKSGAIKPRVEIRPIFLSGAMISFATGYNAKFIVDNKIGQGARIKITRSGEVIPKIVDVLEPSQQRPLVSCDIAYKWGDSGVDIYAIDFESEERQCKIIKHFMRTMGIKYVSDSTIPKLINGGLGSVKSIIMASKDQLNEILASKMSEKIYNNIHNCLNQSSMTTLMAASGCFDDGIGTKRLESFCEKYSIDDKMSIDDIKDIFGFSDIMAKKVVDGLPKFRIFYNDIKPFISTFQAEEKKSIDKGIDKGIDTELTGQYFVFTGFRDRNLKDMIESRGGHVTDAISNKTTGVVTIDNDKISTKMAKAIERKLSIYTKSELEHKLKMN